VWASSISLNRAKAGPSQTGGGEKKGRKSGEEKPNGGQVKFQKY